jgi:hypothetical protein
MGEKGNTKNMEYLHGEDIKRMQNAQMK